MDSIIFQGNVIGMLAYIVPAMLFFSWIIKEVEENLVERKLYIACGLGVVLGTGADIIMILGGINTLLKDKGPLGGKSTAYICKNYACREPVTDDVALRNQLH